MESRFYMWLNRRFPQNYLLKNPFRGFLILALFTFLFAVLYRPLHSHSSGMLTYGETMAIYSIVVAFSAILIFQLLKTLHHFSGIEEWTLSKELFSIIVVLLGMGIGIYFFAFIMEPKAPRWNIATIWDSCKNAFLVGILPFSFFTITNLHHLPRRKTSLYDSESEDDETTTLERRIEIKSKLKKETLSFYPSEFLYAESDGNYILFYLQKENEVKKKIIRNSISEVEKQLTSHPHFFRTHRSFIVNLERIAKKQGNTSGYRLKLKGLSNEIPVSRQNTERFDRVVNEFVQHLNS